MKDSFLAYKQAIKARYEEEKYGDYASFLLQPTSAKLRKLCILLLKENNDPNDRRIFAGFFGFEFEWESIGKIKKENDRFKRFCNFLNGKSDLSDDPAAADLLALLVGYTKRPYQKFINLRGDEGENQKMEELPKAEEDEKLQPFVAVEKEEQFTAPFSLKEGQERKRMPKRSRHVYLILLLLGISVVAGGYMAKDLCFPKKECMQWQDDHYEIIDCQRNGMANICPVVALDEAVVPLRKVKLRKGMRFFIYKKPLYYYYKVSPDSVEFFNGPGLHPITQEPLKKITWHMIHKYVK